MVSGIDRLGIIIAVFSSNSAESNPPASVAYQAVKGDSRSRKGESLVLYAESVDAILWTRLQAFRGEAKKK